MSSTNNSESEGFTKGLEENPAAGEAECNNGIEKAAAAGSMLAEAIIVSVYLLGILGWTALTLVNGQAVDPPSDGSSFATPDSTLLSLASIGCIAAVLGAIVYSVARGRVVNGILMVILAAITITVVSSPEVVLDSISDLPVHHSPFAPDT